METTQDAKSLAAVSIVSVVAVILVGGFVADAQTNTLDYQTELDWNSGLFTNTEVVNDNVQLLSTETEGTWTTGLMNNEVLTSSEVNLSSVNANNSASLTVQYYDESAENISSGTVQNTETFTLNDGTNDLTLAHDDTYSQVAYEFELTRAETADDSPVLESFTATGEKSGLTWTIFGFLAALLGVAALIKIMGRI